MNQITIKNALEALLPYTAKFHPHSELQSICLYLWDGQIQHIAACDGISMAYLSRPDAKEFAGCDTRLMTKDQAASLVEKFGTLNLLTEGGYLFVHNEFSAKGRYPRSWKYLIVDDHAGWIDTISIDTSILGKIPKCVAKLIRGFKGNRVEPFYGRFHFNGAYQAVVVKHQVAGCSLQFAVMPTKDKPATKDTI